jgi:hypothetical protein
MQVKPVVTGMARFAPGMIEFAAPKEKEAVV